MAHCVPDLAQMRILDHQVGDVANVNCNPKTTIRCEIAARDRHVLGGDDIERDTGALVRCLRVLEREAGGESHARIGEGHQPRMDRATEETDTASTKDAAVP